jgi:hypothetical protein
MGYASNGGREVAPDDPGVAVRRVRRGPDAWVLAVSGELSQRSAGLVSGVLSGLKWRSSDEVAQGLARLFNLVAQEGRVVPSDLAAGDRECWPWRR